MRYFSLFSGVGGFELGIERAYADLRPTGEDKKEDNLEDDSSDPASELTRQPPTCIGFSEIDKYASAVLKYRFPNIPNYGDIQAVDAGILPDFDLLVGGFPCQSFSVAGKRGGFEDTRGTLFFEMARIAEAKKPKFWLAENVKGLFSHDEGKTLKVILTTMQQLGYSVSIEIINAKNYGVPQNRERVFIAGYHIPTVCKEVLSGIPPKKTDTFVKITKGFLFQLLLNDSAEVLKAREGESKDLVLGLLVLNAIIKAGQKGNWVLSSETSKALYESFANCSLVEMKERFTTKQGSLDEKSDTLAGTSTRVENKFLSAEERLWANIALLLSNGLDESLNEPSKSITSTLIKQTTEKTTFTYAEMLRTIVSFTLHLRSSSSPLWNEVLSDLIILKVGTNYEPITSQTPERIVGRIGFIRRANLPPTFGNKFILECNTRGERGREVFFERGKDELNTQEKGADVARPVLTPDRLEKRQNGRRMKEDGEPSFTINTQDIHGIYNGERIRRLTPRECEALMSWGMDWTRYGDFDGVVKEISDSQRYKMCGNGVVSEVVEKIYGIL